MRLTCYLRKAISRIAGRNHFDTGQWPSFNITSASSSTNLNEYRNFRMRDLYTAP